MCGVGAKGEQTELWGSARQEVPKMGSASLLGVPWVDSPPLLASAPSKACCIPFVLRGYACVRFVTLRTHRPLAASEPGVVVLRLP